MSSRFRSLDSKISFFAFADIITAVSGVLIFVALLLATDLGRPTDSSSESGTSGIDLRLQETLAQQVEVDAQNHHLEELLATADTAPDLEKLQSDITRLRLQLSEEQKKQAAVTQQMANSQASIAARDKILGLTGLKATVERTLQDAQSIAIQAAKAHDEMDNLDQQVEQTQVKLLKLRQRDGQLWLMPDKSATTKEPILVTVSGTGVIVERFDRPDQRKQWVKSEADTAFESYLHEAKALDQYMVFLVKPSGIELFQTLVKSARDLGFDVGFDALEEDREIHFSTPPAIDDPMPPPASPVAAPEQSTAAPNSPPAAAHPVPNGPNPSSATAATPSEQQKSFFGRLLELGRPAK